MSYLAFNMITFFSKIKSIFYPLLGCGFQCFTQNLNAARLPFSFFLRKKLWPLKQLISNFEVKFASGRVDGSQKERKAPTQVKCISSLSDASLLFIIIIINFIIILFVITFIIIINLANFRFMLSKPTVFLRQVVIRRLFI